MRRVAAALVAAAISLIVPATAPAAVTYTVTREDDPQPFLACTTSDCSLRAAVAAVNAGSGGDTIVVPAGSYVLENSQLVLTRDVTIAGSGARATTVTAGNIRLFEVAAFVTMRGLTLTGGDERWGGAILVGSAGRLDLTESRVTGNRARGQAMGDPMYGGGIYNEDGLLNVSNTTLDANQASFSLAGHGYGGAIATVTAGTTTLTNVTVTGNLARAGSGNGFGGGVYTGPGATTTIVNSTIAGNRAESPTPGFVPEGGNIAGDGTTNVLNTVVAEGEAGQGFANCGPGVTSLGHNLDSRDECGFGAAGDLVNADPLLGALADNGGSTDTRAIGAGSPAFDAGTNAGCPGSDQRGVARPQGAACDIGAIELQVVAQPGTPGGPEVELVLADLRVNPARFRLGSRTTISFTLSADARVTLAFTQRRPGRRVRGRCVKPRRRNARRPRCRRTVTVGRLRVPGVRGANTLRFTGRLARRKSLRPGRYGLVGIAVDAAGRRSQPDRASLRVRPAAVR